MISSFGHTNHTTWSVPVCPHNCPQYVPMNFPVCPHDWSVKFSENVRGRNPHSRSQFCRKCSQVHCSIEVMERHKITVAIMKLSIIKCRMRDTAVWNSKSFKPGLPPKFRTRVFSTPVHTAFNNPKARLGNNIENDSRSGFCITAME